MALYFNAEHLPQPRGEYVLWCDGMGTGAAVANSLSHAANFIFKLHLAYDKAIAQRQDVRAYPLMDGMYVTCRDRYQLQDVMRIAYNELALEFLQHNDCHRHFIARGAVAYGATIHGAEVPDDAFVPGIGTPHENGNRNAFQLSRLSATRNSLLLSSAMAVAFQSESNAPPFGVFVHDSALSVPQLVNSQDRGFPSRLWHWWRGDQDCTQTARELAPAMKEYFETAIKRSRELAYPVEAAKKHQESLAEYFSEFFAAPPAA